MAVAHSLEVASEDLVNTVLTIAPPRSIHGRCDSDDERDLIDRVMGVVADAPLDGHIAVITPAQTRYRPFPARSDHD